MEDAKCPLCNRGAESILHALRVVKRSNQFGITLEYYGQILASGLGIFMNG